MHKIKGIILAAGESKRFFNDFRPYGKAFLYLDGKLLIEHSIMSLIEQGIEEIRIGINPKDHSVAKSLTEKYKEITVVNSLTKGTAGCLQDCLEEDTTQAVVLYGDTIYFSPLTSFCETLRELEHGSALIGVTHTYELEDLMAVIDNPHGYDLHLKPHCFKKGMGYVGIFGFHGSIYEIIKDLKPSERGEKELTDVIRIYAHNNRLAVAEYLGEMVDVNSRERLLMARSRIFQNKKF